MGDIFKHRSTNPYVPPEMGELLPNHPSVSNPTTSKIEDMIARVLKRVESTDNGGKRT